MIGCINHEIETIPQPAQKSNFCDKLQNSNHNEIAQIPESPSLKVLYPPPSEDDSQNISLLGNKTVGDETLNTTTGAPDLSLFDLTLTTGLSENPDQTTLINHLCDIQVSVELVCCFLVDCQVLRMYVQDYDCGFIASE